MAQRQTPTGPSQRQQRVAELIRHAIAEVLQRGDIQDPVLSAHVITVPQVRMSPDLKLATAYIMPLGGLDEAPVLAALARKSIGVRSRIALVLGAGLGWQRGKMMRITLDPDTHRLGQTSSPAALLFILLLIAVRSGAKGAINYAGPAGLDPMALTDILMALALGLFTAQRLEMYLRGRRMLAAARSGAQATSATAASVS